VHPQVTEDGIRLSTPLFRQRYSKALAKYGAEITYFDGNNRTSFVYFGNWLVCKTKLLLYLWLFFTDK